MICRKRRIIFVHIPKCGGTSIENALWPYEADRTEANLWMGFVRPMYNKYQTGGLQHLTAQQICTEVGPQLFETCRRFAIVRHPLARLVSQYRYMASRPDLRGFVGLPARFDFSTYLDAIFAKAHVQWTPQHVFLRDEEGRMLVKHIYKLETLSQNWPGFCADLGVKVPLLHDNKSAHAPQPRISAADRARVEEFYAEDYALLDYAY